MWVKYAAFDHLLAFDPRNVFFQVENRIGEQDVSFATTQVGILFARELSPRLPVEKYQKAFFENEVFHVRSHELITAEFLHSLGVTVPGHQLDIQQAFLTFNKRKEEKEVIPLYMKDQKACTFNGEEGEDFEQFKSWVLEQLLLKGISEEKLSGIAMQEAPAEGYSLAVDDFLLAVLMKNTVENANETVLSVAKYPEVAGLRAFIRLVQQYSTSSVKVRLQAAGRLLRDELDVPALNARENIATDLSLIRDLLVEYPITPEIVCASKLCTLLEKASSGSSVNRELKADLEGLPFTELTIDYILGVADQVELPPDRMESQLSAPGQGASDTTTGQEEMASRGLMEHNSSGSKKSKKRGSPLLKIAKTLSKYAKEIDQDGFEEKIQGIVAERVFPIPEDVRGKQREIMNTIRIDEVYEADLGNEHVIFDSKTPESEIKDFAIRTQTGDATKEGIVEDVWEAIKEDVKGVYQNENYFVRLGAVAVAKESLKASTRRIVDDAIRNLPIVKEHAASSGASEPGNRAATTAAVATKKSAAATAAAATKKPAAATAKEPQGRNSIPKVKFERGKSVLNTLKVIRR